MPPNVDFYLTTVLPGCGFVWLLWRIYHEASSRSWVGQLRSSGTDLYPLRASTQPNALRIVGSPNMIPPKQANIGLDVLDPLLSDAESVFLYRNFKQLVKEFGTPFATPYAQSTQQSLKDAKLPANIEGALSLTGIRIGDSGATPRDIWGIGDRLRPRDVPLWLRHFADVLKKSHSLPLGDLRHIQIDYYPSGVPYMPPTRMPDFIGYDYFVMPLRAPKHRDTPLVLTLSPTLRSKVSDLAEVGVNSWTTRDWDARLERSSALHVHSLARFDWRLAIRPTQWFDSPTNPIQLDSSGLLSESPTSFGAWLRRLVRREPVIQKSSSFHKYTPQEFADDDGVVIVTVSFEGTNAKRKSLLGRPENIYFGLPPGNERKVWDDDGKSKWNDIDWRQVSSWRDLYEIGRIRVAALRSRPQFGSLNDISDE